MYSVLSKFKICEPATKSRERTNFLANYLIGRQIDFTDNSGSAFSSTSNEFTLDGITFNSVHPVDRYGMQENFNFPSEDLRRREMFWSTSSFPVSTGSNPTDGFNLFGTYIAIKKISTETDLSVLISSISSIKGYVQTYDYVTGALVFKYSTLPEVYLETDSLGNKLFQIETELQWSGGTYDESQLTNTKIGTPYGPDIISLEKYKEIILTMVSFDFINSEIKFTATPGLTEKEIDNLQSVSPSDQKVRVVPLGYYSITNNAIGVPVASSLNSMQSRAALGISSYLYYGVPYQTSFLYKNTSKDYEVRTPVFKLDFSGSNEMFVMAIISERNTNSRIVPSGFKLEII
jgi:hypothetical protein